MPFLRFICLVAALLVFFFVMVPVQGLLARRRPSLADQIPLLFCRTLLRILRVRVVLTGRRPVRGPQLLAVNHVSWIDVLVMGSLTPFCFLAKQEVASWPILSSFAHVQGTVFIDRRRRRGIPPANRAMAERMGQGRAVLLFPEGTTYDGTALGPFFSSHFAAARDFLQHHGDHRSVSVQPVALAYSRPFAAWIGDDALLPHLWRVLRREPLTCRVAFAAPVPYTGESDRKVVSRLARSAIADLLATSTPMPAGERLSAA
ncbi:MAG: lysophospholipid acyltransferase family protein [Beijerinckiaceae bacterium]|nr:lysophospholipid acyltransferase family protein [Beijerinckiaceae bacterium]